MYYSVSRWNRLPTTLRWFCSPCSRTAVSVVGQTSSNARSHLRSQNKPLDWRATRVLDLRRVFAGVYRRSEGASVVVERPGVRRGREERQQSSESEHVPRENDWRDFVNSEVLALPVLLSTIYPGGTGQRALHVGTCGQSGRPQMRVGGDPLLVRRPPTELISSRLVRYTRLF